jgi:hypothetical protein
MKIEPWCTGKIGYPTKAKAIERIERQRKKRTRRKDGHMILQAYLCQSCRLWHVGGTTKQVHQCDAFGRTIRKKWPTPPKERADGNTRRPADKGWKASMSTVRPDEET